MKKADKLRLDQLLVSRGLVESRESAQRLILARKVKIGDRFGEKPGQKVSVDLEITLLEDLKYVSRGGFKLERALDAFHVDVTGRSVLDIGASTGGFTDCLLQRGARKVLAVDVGYGQLAWKLREDPRVIVLERFNARQLMPDSLPEPVDLAVMDVSFIGAQKILDPLAAVTIEAIVLLKPQFEAGPADVPRGGVIRDPRVHRKVLEDFYAHLSPWTLFGLIDSPIAGASGNREFLVHLKQSEGGWSEGQVYDCILELTDRDPEL